MNLQEIGSLLAEVWLSCESRAVWDPDDGRKPSAQQLALLSVMDLDHPRTVGELAERTGVRPAATSQMLDRLERRGLVRRQRSGRDARVVQVRLTQEGALLLADSSPLDPARLAALLENLTQIEQGEILRGLRLLARASERVPRP